MMIPEVGSMPKVSGRSIATPDGGPTPGSAPIRMPIITPAIAIRMLNGVSATPNPMARLAKKSILLESPDDSFRHGHAQPVHEHEPVEARRGERDRERHPPRVAPKVAHENEQIERGTDHHSGERQERDEGDGDAEHHQHVAQPFAARQPRGARISLFQASDEHAEREADHHETKPERQEGGARTARAPPRVLL